MSKAGGKKSTTTGKKESTLASEPPVATSENAMTPDQIAAAAKEKELTAAAGLDIKENDPDVSKLELKLLENGKLNGYILLPSDIARTWRAPRQKEELVRFLQELYKPRSQFEQERVEYNQINILAEYIQFNMIFAKNELLFDQHKTAVVVQLFWDLLEFDPDEAEEKPMNASGS